MTEMVTRRKALSLAGLALAALAAPVVTVTDAEAKTAGTERREGRREGRHHRREGRHEARNSRRKGRSGKPENTQPVSAQPK